MVVPLYRPNYNHCIPLKCHSSYSTKPMQESNLAWLAGRAGGAWYDVIWQSLATLHDPSVLERFLTIDVSGHENMADQAWIGEERKRLDSYFCLLIELASSRSWSQMMFTNCSPNSLVGCLHPSNQVRQQLLHHQRDTWEAILRAEQVVFGEFAGSRAVRACVQQRLDDISWYQIQLARETYVVCARNNWQSGNPEIEELTKAIFNNPYCTKYQLEDLFAHLSSVSKLSSLATPMGKHLDVNHHNFGISQSKHYILSTEQ